jgi:hypothetical protein
VGYEELVESRIQDAIASGAFARLKGEGQPLDLGRGALAGENWLGFHMLDNAGILPAWLLLAREIENDLAQLERVDALHRALVGEVAASGNWSAFGPRIRVRRDQYEELARAIRRKQDQFNMDAPGIRTERPGIWVEHHLNRLDVRLRDVGCPLEG